MSRFKSLEVGVGWANSDPGAACAGVTQSAAPTEPRPTRSPQVFKFAVYVSTPILLVGAVVYRPDSLDAVIRNVWLHAMAPGTGLPFGAGALPCT